MASSSIEWDDAAPLGLERARSGAVGLTGSGLANGANSLLPIESRWLSGAKKESWNNVESCQSDVRSARRVATVLASESRA